MSQLKFDKNGLFKPQRVKYVVKHNELDEEFIEKVLQKKNNKAGRFG